MTQQPPKLSFASFFPPALLLGVICVVVSLLAPRAADAQDPPLYKQANAPVDARVADLVSRMTLEEKIAQMLCIWNEKGTFRDENGVFQNELARAQMPLGIGQIARPSDRQGEGQVGFTPGRDPKETAEFANAIQKFALEETRLGIPVMFHEEGLHGYKANGGTSFPQAIALASLRNPELVERVYTIVGKEIAVRGVKHVLSPVVDVVRDPRWGRIEETFGEDPYLTSQIGLAAVRGFQGRSFTGIDQPLEKDRVFATLKHMTGHGEPENGINVGPANISRRTLREFFFPPFKVMVQEGHAMSVMASYNEIDGVPSHANTWLLGDVLRGEWGFEGYVVGDYGAVRELRDRHAVAPDLEQAAILAVKAGVDIELPRPEAFPELLKAVNDGKLDIALIDKAVARMMRAKFLAGLFDNPYVDPDAAEAATDTPEARALALESAEKSLILLKNDGLLPLNPSDYNRIAVIGPNAEETLLGTYTDTPRYTVSILEGIRERLGEDHEIEFSEGARITEGRNLYTHPVTPTTHEDNVPRIAAAVEVARRADLVILAVGGNEHTSREGYAENHLGDRADVQMFGDQNELVGKILDLGKPTVVVLIHGRPLAINDIQERANAVLDGWFLGQETGHAVTKALLGDINPGGKLPVSVPRSVGQLPVFYNHKPTARRGYLFSSTEPLYPFGHGLSYTTFEISEPTLSSAQIAADGESQVSVTVKNTGQRAGDEVVQLYVRDLFSSVTRPVKELKAFQRVSLAPGESKTVTFTVGEDELAMWDVDMKWTVEPGDFDLMVGPNSVDLKSATLTVAQ